MLWAICYYLYNLKNVPQSRKSIRIVINKEHNIFGYIFQKIKFLRLRHFPTLTCFWITFSALFVCSNKPLLHSPQANDNFRSRFFHITFLEKCYKGPLETLTYFLTVSTVSPLILLVLQYFAAFVSEYSKVWK